MNKSNACILTLNKTLSAKTMSALELLNGKVGERFEVNTKAFSSMKTLLSQLSERLDENVLVVIAAEPGSFYPAKETFCQALSLQLEKNDAVVASLPTTYAPKSEREYITVSQFPTNSDVIYSHNGLFSGFCIKSATQRIMYLPLDADLLAVMSDGMLGVLLDRVADENNIVVADFMDENETQEPQAPASVDDILGDDETVFSTGTSAKADEPETIEPATIDTAAQPAAPVQQSGSSILVNSAKEMLSALEDSGYTVAFAQCGPSKSIRSLIDALPNTDEYIVFDDVAAEKWSSGEFNDYFAGVARSTLDRCETEIAGAASTIYNDATGKFMFYVVADDKGAKITKVSGDDANEIVFRCVTGLIKAVIGRINLKVSEEGAKPKEKTASSGKVVKSSVPLIITAIMLILAIIASAAVAFYLKGADGNTDTGTADTSGYLPYTEPVETTSQIIIEQPTQQAEESTQA